MASIFITGFPGFLGSELVERLLQHDPRNLPVNCLVQASYREAAEKRLQAIEAKGSGYRDRIHLYEGNITEPNLGLGDCYRKLSGETMEIYHLAAVYDLGVSRQVAMEVNVEGTRRMLAFAECCVPHLQRFQYVSTCYVSGRYQGVFTESDLIKDQSFNNHYEETKYLAEIEVQQQMEDGLPATIYRPSIVVGDSLTGATQKYDGIYYLLRWMLRQPGYVLIPLFDDPARFEVNLVPRDFVVDALAHLSRLPESNGKVYQLCDPQPLLVDQIIDVLLVAMARKGLRIRLPKALVKVPLENLKFLRTLTGIEPETMEYFTHPTRYTCENTLADLRGSGIHCPPFAEYARNLIAFMQEHPEISSDAMV